MKIAVIGAGISGMCVAYLLSTHHDMALYEEAINDIAKRKTVKCFEARKKTL